MKEKYHLIDPHYKHLSKKQKQFLGLTTLGFFAIAIAGFVIGYFSVFEAIVVVILGIVFMQLIKIEYRLTDLEK